MSNNVYKNVAAFVTSLYEENPRPSLLYHNLVHTKNVVQRAEEIAAHYQLSESETMAIYIAAWFHDTGNVFAEADKHEEKSVELMKDFMHKEGIVNETVLTDIANCILATKMPQSPKNLMEEILCDADTYHFGTKDFKKTNKLLRKEYALRGYDKIVRDWRVNTVKILETHHFYTSYCRALLSSRKEQNIEWAKKKTIEKVTGTPNAPIPHADAPLNEQESANMKRSLLSRGVQTMFKQTSVNHIRLTQLADSKAHILISVNAIIISLILSLLVRRLSDAPYLTIPAIIFLVSSLSTIVLAILSARPMVTQGTFTREEVMNKKTNLLFFGNFFKANLDEYEWAMSTLIKDSDYLYSTLIKDIYQIGVVLARKYRLVYLAYNVFMIGLILSVVSFFIASVIHVGQGHASGSIQDATGSPF
jgi:predicted metal-dependent HD superfamily phosphohydrolase